MGEGLKRARAATKSRSCLSDLPDRPGRTMAVNVTSITGALRELAQGEEAINAAGSNGALTVWKDNQGRWQGEFMRLMVSFNRTVFTRKADIRDWLKAWWPNLGR